MSIENFSFLHLNGSTMPEVIDSPENIPPVTLKITEDDRDWVAAEQKRLKRKTGKKPTQAELFTALREAYCAIIEGTAAYSPQKTATSHQTTGGTVSPVTSSGVLAQWPDLPDLLTRFVVEVEQLIEILRSGNQVATVAIRNNLVAFRELVLRMGPDERVTEVPGSQSVSPGKMDEVHGRVREHEQAYEAEKSNIKRLRITRKRGRKPSGGTGTGN